MSRPSPFPNKGSKTHKLLTYLLNGERVDPFFALMEINLPTAHARVSELRKLGWPIRSIQVPHPKLDERVTAYVLDTHFRAWYITQQKETGTYPHPLDYSGQEGRGKFAKDAAA